MKNLLSGMKVRTYATPFSVVTAEHPLDGALAVIHDHRETTVVIATSLLQGTKTDQREDEWRLFTFETTLDFSLVGFLAKVSTTLAQAGVSIFVLSSYSTDHLLIKDKQRKTAIKVLQSIGCIMIIEHEDH